MQLYHLKTTASSHRHVRIVIWKREHGWTCFHCGETFTTVGDARDHFLRKAEEDLDQYRAEDTDQIVEMGGKWQREV